jgi:transposase
LAAGVRQAEVARQLGVSTQAVSVWHRRWKGSGTDGLRSKGPSGPAPRLSDQQLAEVEQALLEGPTANGFVGELWTLDRTAVVIRRLTGCATTPPTPGPAAPRLGWTVQRPIVAPPSAIRTPSTSRSRSSGRGSTNAQRHKARLVFFDESALSLTPNGRPTWAPRGRTPTLVHPFHPFHWKKASMAAALCDGVRGRRRPALLPRHRGQRRPERLVEVLGELRKFLGGEKATLLWAGLPAHRSRALRDWLNTQRSWLVVERLPAYAPDLNPVEGLWSSLKAVELANLATPSLGEVIDQAHKGIERVRGTPHLAYSFLRHAGLSVA